MIEAFALGTPVLVADIGEIPELIQDDINCIIFQAVDISDLRVIIQKMLECKVWNYKQIQDLQKSNFQRKTITTIFWKSITKQFQIELIS